MLAALGMTANKSTCVFPHASDNVRSAGQSAIISQVMN
jgi:hypothetical protein